MISHKNRRVLISSLFNFQGPFFAAPRLERLIILPQTLPFVNTFFQKNLKLFLIVFYPQKNLNI